MTVDLDSILEVKKNKTLAFLVIRRDTILYERYFSDYKESSVIPSFSMAKSITSALIGIALGEGKIKSTDQPVTDFIPELSETDPRYKKITLQHLLDMRSGLDFNEESYKTPFADVAQLYYSRNIKKRLLKTSIEKPPNQEYTYQSANTQLLGWVLERSTGISPAQYLEEKIWKPVGMEFPASWSIDSRKNQTVKTYCCLNARARDYAKFGSLYLKKGNWEGKSIVPEAWVEVSTAPDPFNRGYKNQWYSTRREIYFDDLPSAKANLQPHERVMTSTRYPGKYFIYRYSSAFMAAGLLGQFIFVDPEKEVIIVRLGTGQGKITWSEMFNRIIECL